MIECKVSAGPLPVVFRSFKVDDEDDEALVAVVAAAAVEEVMVMEAGEETVFVDSRP
jgi:hypothetical protein